MGHIVLRYLSVYWIAYVDVARKILYVKRIPDSALLRRLWCLSYRPSLNLVIDLHEGGFCMPWKMMPPTVRRNLFLPIVMLLALVAAACSPLERQHVEFAGAWGTEGSADGQFLYVEDFAFDPGGNLLATDALRKDVQVFARDGAFKARFGHEGSGEATLEKPEGIAVASDGTIYV